MTLPNKDYQTLLNGLKEKIRQARVKAILSVNYYLIQVYWEIGNTIAQQQQAEGWGAKTVDNLSRDLKAEFTDLKGLSPRNLRYMRDFATAWPHFPFLQEPLAKLTDDPILQPPAAKLGATRSLKVKNQILQPPAAKPDSTFDNQTIQPLLAQIPWTHHTIILDKVKTTEERLFYIRKTIDNGWSKNVLGLQMESGLYKREGKAINNFSQTLPPYASDLAAQTFKSPYILDFLSLSESAKEKDIEKGLIEHLKRFMLELGRGFAYVGNQYNLVVKDDDYFLDLLFYNYHLHCFVVFELKIGEFKPEFTGKLNFYINTVNAQIKGAADKPTIGILLCKTPNDTVVKYSLQGISTPMGVADYKIAKALPKELKSELPSVKELENALESRTGFEKQLEKLKPLIGKYKNSRRKTRK